MSLMVFNVTAAVKSPCPGCPNRNYPECRTSCESINAYLAFLGLPPIQEDEVADLAKLYPARCRGKSDQPRRKLGPRQLMPEGQTKAALSRLAEIVRSHDMPKYLLAKRMGISRSYLNALLDGSFSRIGKKFHDVILKYPMGDAT